MTGLTFIIMGGVLVIPRWALIKTGLIVEVEQIGSGCFTARAIIGVRSGATEAIAVAISTGVAV